MKKIAIGVLIAIAIMPTIQPKADLKESFEIPWNTINFSNRNAGDKLLNSGLDYIYRNEIYLPTNVSLLEDLKKQENKYNYELIVKEIEDHVKLYESQENSRRIQRVGFNPYDVTQKSEIKAKELAEVLRNVPNGQGLADYASYFVEAEKIYGINALFICSIAAEESGWGRYRAGNGTNLTGYQVYNRSAEGAHFSSVRENILETAKLIKLNYTNHDGRYNTRINSYSGTGVSVWEINQKYCLTQDGSQPLMSWSNNLISISNKLESTFKSIYN